MGPLSFEGRVAVVIPSYFDLENVGELGFQLDKFLPSHKVFALDESLGLDPYKFRENSHITRVTPDMRLGQHEQVVQFLRSPSFRAMLQNYEFIVVMDGDGEDKPNDVVKLLLHASVNELAVAKRASLRKESPVRTLAYIFFQVLSMFLSGKSFRTGAFSAMTKDWLIRNIDSKSFDFGFSAGLAYLSSSRDLLRLHRGERLRGNSKTNFTSQMSFGLEVLSVFHREISVRLLIWLGIVFVLGIPILGYAFSLWINELSSPGWMTVVLSSYVATLLAIFLIFLVSLQAHILIVLTSRKTPVYRYISVHSREENR